MFASWRGAALAEIRGIKTQWADRYGWCPHLRRGKDHLDLLVTFTRRRPEPSQAFVLRLRYGSDFKIAGRREEFVDPKDPSKGGPEYWPKNMRGVAMRDRPYLCLEGTWGFHCVLHPERPAQRASLNRLLMEIEKCLNS